MKNQNLINYVSTQVQRGIPIEQIKQTLINNRWKEEDIDNAISAFMQANSSTHNSNEESSSNKIEDGSVDPRFLIAWIAYSVTVILVEIMVLSAPEFFPLVLLCCGNLFFGWTVFNFILFFVFLSKKKDKGVLQLIGFYLIGYLVLTVGQGIKLVMQVMEDPDFDPFEPDSTTHPELTVLWVLYIIFHIILLVLSIRLYKKNKKQ